MQLLSQAASLLIDLVGEKNRTMKTYSDKCCFHLQAVKRLYNLIKTLGDK